MLVGDRGRVIPFRHFKAIALGVCCLSFLLLVAFVVISILYVGQGQKLARLEQKLKEAQLQSSKLRDEKDLYLTKLMLTQKQEKSATENPESAKAAKPAEAGKSAASKPEPPIGGIEPVDAPPVKKKSPAKPPAPKIKWNADIRRFSVSYDPKSEVLKAQFRIYNTSKPKKRLSGRSVVVFKAQDDPPGKWMPVPRVQLNSGEPTGTRGQVFRVRNYLTMKFRAYRQKTPIAFNSATVFVFSNEGRMLASKDFYFKVKTPPPPKKLPAPPPPKKQPAPSPPAVQQTSPVPTPAPTTGTSGVTPSPETTTPTDQQSRPLPATGSEPASDKAPGTPRTPSDQTQPPVDDKPSDAAEPPPSGASPSDASDSPVQPETPPEAEQTVTAPPPKVEGEAK